MKIGTICYATNQGLGILAKSFYDNGVITDAVVIKHSHHFSFPYWYPLSPMVDGRRLQTGKEQQLVRALCRHVDVMLFFETPFDWSVLDYCRSCNVKTVLMVMYECMPKHLPSKPDLILCPSLLDKQYYPDGKYLPVPVKVPWKKREEALVFVHNAGHGGLKNRNGTGELLDAMRLVKNPVKLILRSQKKPQWDVNDPRIDLRVGTFPYEELYTEGDVFIFPEKFNGLSLPLQEARAAGMLVMASDRFPNNDYLPPLPLIKVKGYQRGSISGRCHEFDEAIIDPEDIAVEMDRWYGVDIGKYSESGKKWGEFNSWETLKPRYEELFERLKEGKL